MEKGRASREHAPGGTVEAWFDDGVEDGVEDGEVGVTKLHKSGSGLSIELGSL
jgi:hypothetical protein